MAIRAFARDFFKIAYVASALDLTVCPKSNDKLNSITYLVYTLL